MCVCVCVCVCGGGGGGVAKSKHSTSVLSASLAKQISVMCNPFKSYWSKTLQELLADLRCPFSTEHLVSDSPLLVHCTRVPVLFSTPQFVFSYLDEACLYHTQCTCISLIPTDNARSKPLLNVKMDGYDKVSHLWYWCQLRDWNCSEAVHNLHNTIQQGNSTVFLYQAYFICIDFCWQALLSEGCCFRTGIPHIGITRSLLKLFEII